MMRAVIRPSFVTKEASLSPSVTFIGPAPTVRPRSRKARKGTSLVPSVATPGMSRTASRYESVATSLKLSSAASNRTPVNVGRASSADAAIPTWESALMRLVPSRAISSPGPSASAILGKSSTTISLSLNRGPFPVISTSPSAEARVTAPTGSFLTASAANFAGITVLPSSVTSTSR